MRAFDLAGLMIRPPDAGLLVSDPASRRSLGAVIAILSFLAALAALGAEIVASRSAAWTAQIAREATIQIRPRAGRDVGADLSRATEAARAVAGIAAARILPKAEAEDLLAPWLGRGIDLGALPVPRLVVLTFATGARPDLAALRQRLADIPGATVDDSGARLSRLAEAGRAVVLFATAIVVLVLAATALAVIFATRGAVAASRDVVEILHFVGADDRFIAATFAGGILRLALAAAVPGAVAACITMALAGSLASPLDGPDGCAGLVAPGPWGYAAAALVGLAIAALAGAVSVLTVQGCLKTDPAV